MNVSAKLAKHFRRVYNGGNWTDVNLRDTLAGVSWQQAMGRIGDHNTIVALVYHIHYYVQAVLSRMRGEPLTASDKESFNHPPVSSEADWNEVVKTVFAEAEVFAAAVTAVPEGQWDSFFADERYGTWYYNVQGVIEHTHYHLGQIALLKKLLPATEKAE